MTRCTSKVMHGYFSRRCSRNAVSDGYCKQHHPDSRKARRKKRDEIRALKDENSDLALLRKAIQKIRSMEAEFSTINDLIYAKGVILGSDDYFAIRGICTKYMEEKD